METGILFQGVSKRYHRANPQRAQTLQELALGGFRGLRAREWFWALKEVSLEVKPGKMMGVIGRNGAGKSTLLHLAGGVGQPERGKIDTRGRIGALIDLGAGFHPELTGRENVLVNGVVAGLTRQEVRKRLDAIVEFAELRDFIDSPLRTYSTGMQMRLAFSVAIHVDPAILLIDEVLAVGDLAFQQKCLDRIAWFKSQGCAILLVSHEMGVIRKMCDEAIWLEQGTVAERGASPRVVESYVRMMQAETRRRTPSGGAARGQARYLANGMELRLNENRFGSQEMEIGGVRLLSQLGEPVVVLGSGEGLRIEIDYNAPQPVESPNFGITITNEDGLTLFDASVSGANLSKPILQGKGVVCLQLDRLDFASGRYFVDVGVYQHDWEYAYDYHWNAYPLQVIAETSAKGLILPPHRWELQEEHPPPVNSPPGKD